MDQKSWYIPRPSLSSIKNQSKFYHRDSEMIDIDGAEQGVKDKSNKNNKNATMSSSSSSSVISSNDRYNKKELSREACSSKRDSRSSQGSSDSEQSIHVCKDSH
jgi:hypothetical protein